MWRVPKERQGSPENQGRRESRGHLASLFQAQAAKTDALDHPDPQDPQETETALWSEGSPDTPGPLDSTANRDKRVRKGTPACTVSPLGSVDYLAPRAPPGDKVSPEPPGERERRAHLDLLVLLGTRVRLAPQG